MRDFDVLRYQIKREASRLRLSELPELIALLRAMADVFEVEAEAYQQRKPGD
jgi:hypothetical protein